MKKYVFLVLPCLLLLSVKFAKAQDNENCKEHPHFSSLRDHSVEGCEKKEFDKLVLYKTGKNGSYTEMEKEGEVIAISYKYNKEWNNRPSAIQIYQNYVNAILKNNGEILQNTESAIYATYKKGGDVFWMKVLTDGSGYYYVTTLREAKMRQDVVLNGGEIKKNILEEGKAVFYNIYFDTDQAILKPNSAPALAEIAGFLKENPSLRLFVVGHTDNTGSYEHNITLSKNRALAVIAELTAKYNIPKDQLEAQGVGPLAPVASNENEEGKAKNRRVELVKSK